MTPKKAVEYIVGIDLWRHYNAKQNEIYEAAGLNPKDSAPFDLNFRDSLEIHKQRFLMLAHHSGRSALIMAGTIGALEISEQITRHI